MPIQSMIIEEKKKYEWLIQVDFKKIETETEQYIKGSFSVHK